MAKAKKAADGISEDFMAEMAEETGGERLDKADLIKYFVDTGSLAVNYICSGKFINGGIPGGRMTEIYGPSASSKSLLGSNILAGAQKLGGVAVLLDTENAANSLFIQNASHANPKKINRYTTISLEKCFAKIGTVIDYVRKKNATVPIVIVFDSITVCPTDRELRECDLPEKYSQADFKRIVGGKEQPGERAKVCSKELRKLNDRMTKTGATVVIMNQTRSQIGVMYGNPEVKGGGGNALTFYASCILRTQTQKKIEQKLTAKKKRILGVNIKVENKKCRAHRPFVQTDGIKLMFDNGMHPTSGLLSLLMDADRVKMNGSGSFSILPQWGGGKEVKFKANLDENCIDLELLYQYPQLLDATSKEELEAYLNPFEKVLAFKKDDSIVETNVSEDEDVDSEIDELLDAMAEDDEELTQEDEEA